MSELVPKIADGTALTSIPGAVVLLVLNIVFTTLRFAARWHTRAGFGWDDWLIIPSVLINVVLCSMAIFEWSSLYDGMVVKGLLTYVGDGLPPYLQLLFKMIVAESFLYCAGVTIPKFSLLALYLRVFVRRSERVVVWVIIAILILHYITATFTTFAVCRPFSDLWNTDWSQNPNCLDWNMLVRWVSVPNLITDVVMLVLPIPLIFRLNTSLSKKLITFGTLLLGSVGVITSALRTYYFFADDLSNDALFGGYRLMIWTITEPSTYLIAACLPTLAPLFVGTANWGLTKRSGGRSGGAGSGSGPVPSYGNQKSTTTSQLSRSAMRRSEIMASWGVKSPTLNNANKRRTGSHNNDGITVTTTVQQSSVYGENGENGFGDDGFERLEDDDDIDILNWHRRVSGRGKTGWIGESTAEVSCPSPAEAREVGIDGKGVEVGVEMTEYIDTKGLEWRRGREPESPA